jgi:hypothetical protein
MVSAVLTKIKLLTVTQTTKIHTYTAIMDYITDIYGFLDDSAVVEVIV